MRKRYIIYVCTQKMQHVYFCHMSVITMVLPCASITAHGNQQCTLQYIHMAWDVHKYYFLYSGVTLYRLVRPLVASLTNQGPSALPALLHTLPVREASVVRYYQQITASGISCTTLPPVHSWYSVVCTVNTCSPLLFAIHSEALRPCTGAVVC